jgi:hypothetical protein
MHLRLVLSPIKQRFTSSAWSRRIKETARREEIGYALTVGSVIRRDRRALESGLAMNPGLPPMNHSESFAEASELAAVAEDDRILVLADFQSGALKEPGNNRLEAYNVLLIKGTDTPNGYKTLSSLIQSSSHHLVAHDVVSGTAMFRRNATHQRSGYKGSAS